MSRQILTDQINASPEPLRSYAHGFETCSIADLVWLNESMRQRNAELNAALGLACENPNAPQSEEFRFLCDGKPNTEMRRSELLDVIDEMQADLAKLREENAKYSQTLRTSFER